MSQYKIIPLTYAIFHSNEDPLDNKSDVTFVKLVKSQSGDKMIELSQNPVHSENKLLFTMKELQTVIDSSRKLIESYETEYEDCDDDE